MMAVSALSLSRKDPAVHIQGLHHYQQTLPFLQASLQETQALFSDGAFLTHFLLLIYEVWPSQLPSLVCHVKGSI
jgi:hypothetical protein